MAVVKGITDIKSLCFR